METLEQLYKEFQNENICLYNPDKRVHNLPCKYCGKNFKNGDYIIQKPLDFTGAYHAECYRKLINKSTK